MCSWKRGFHLVLKVSGRNGRLLQVSFFLKVLVLVFCVAGMSASANEVHAVGNMEQMNDLLAAMAGKLQQSFRIRLVDDLSRHNIRKVISSSSFADFSRSYSYMQHGDAYLINIQYMDAARMLAAYRKPALLSKLSHDEKRALSKARSRVRELVKPDMGHMAVAKVLHDDLVNRASYDRASGPGCTTMLLTDKGVCDAYSRCMYLMLNMAGVPCIHVLGSAGGPHAWNMVQMENGEWYHLDATWDDPKMRGGAQVLRHQYFCLTDSEIRRDHKWNRRQYPATPWKDAVYFRKNGLFFKDYEAFWKAAQQAYVRGEVIFNAYLTCFQSSEKFQESLRAFQSNGGKVELTSWSPPRNGQKKGVVALCFNRKKGAPLPPDEDEGTVPVEQDASWLDRGIWKDVHSLLDVDTVMREGSKLLLKGINAAENAAENSGELKMKGQEAYEGLRKLWE